MCGEWVKGLGSEGCMHEWQQEGIGVEEAL